MKTIVIFIIFFTLQVTLANNRPPLSECYSYHTPQYYEVFEKDHKIIFQHTIKDPNTISYVSRKTIVLDSINNEGLKIIAEDQSSILFSTVDGHFILEKDIYEIETQGVTKIGDNNIITQTVGTNFICKKGIWYYITPIKYNKGLNENEVKDMPKNIELLLAGALREGTLYKNNDSVFVFNNESLTFRTIKNLTGSQVKYETTNTYFKQHFLYDENTFYFLDFNNMIDYSEQFTSSDHFTSLKNAEIVYVGLETTINTNDGIIWLFLKFEKEDENGVSKKILPLEASYIGLDKELILYKGKVCNDSFGIINDANYINTDSILDIQQLTKDEYFYSDQKSKYLFDYDKNSFSPISWLPATAQFYNYNGTYGYRGNNPFYADENLIYFIKDPKEKYKTLKHSSNIKDLKLSYAYDL